MGQIFNKAKNAWNGLARRVGLSRSKPMAFGSALKRTPFRRKQPIKSGPISLARGNLQRQTPINKRSAKRAAEQKVWNEFTELKISMGMGCAKCNRKDSPDVRLVGHHWLPKGRGGKSTFDNHVLTCPKDHRWIHDNPADAEACGLLAPSKQTITPVQDKAPSQRGAA